ncbi:hypothetical protein LTS18_003858, partial [Coniosporium uncinatum]
IAIAVLATLIFRRDNGAITGHRTKPKSLRTIKNELEVEHRRKKKPLRKIKAEIEEEIDAKLDELHELKHRR